jgi:4-hydroxy-2-oxoheptanedioate aldolase
MEDDANHNRFVILQIEDPEPLAELEVIASLPGYDMLFFGPGDFSQAIGKPGAWSDPEIIEARKRVAEVAQKYGKYAGTVGSPEQIESLKTLGYQFVSLGADVLGLKNYFHSLLQSPDSNAAQSYLEI